MGFFGELAKGAFNAMKESTDKYKKSYEQAKGAFNAMKESTDKYKKSYDSSSDISMDAGSRGGDNSLVKAIKASNRIVKSWCLISELRAEIKAGNRIVKFGNYFINDNKTKEPIEWRVLEVSNNKALLITKDAIDCKPYNNEFERITWEYCSLRHWLNNEFINQAFSKEEQNEIVLTNISNPNNAFHRTNGGNNTQDKIFLLSIDETQKYFKDDKDRECKATNYAKKQGEWTSDYKKYLGNCSWWLRSPGHDQNYATGVYSDGDFLVGINVSYNNIAVRPALYINL